MAFSGKRGGPGWSTMGRIRSTVNDYALAWLRIAIGILFLILVQYKIWGDKFARHGFAVSIHQFLNGHAYPFMVLVLRDLVLPHAGTIAYVIGYGELCIGIGLLLGIMVRTASFFGLIYMIVLLLSSNYPGPHAAIWQYFGAALNHLVFALCFVAFGMGDATRVWSVPSYYRHKLRQLAQEEAGNPDSSFPGSNVFGK